jgi:hypothetical protein
VDHEALLKFVEAVEEDCGGIWIEHDEHEDTVEVSLCGTSMTALGEAYIVACRAVNRPIMARLCGRNRDLLTLEETERLVDLARFD